MVLSLSLYEADDQLHSTIYYKKRRDEPMRFRHIVLLACIAALLSFASCAVAQEAGHVNPKATVDPTPAVEYVPTPEDIVISADIPVSVDDVTPLPSAPGDFTADKIHLPDASINRISVQTAVRITLHTYEQVFSGEKALVGQVEPESAYITLKNYPTDGAKTHLYAFIKAKDEAVYSTSGDYYYFPATLDETELSFTLNHPSDFFSSNDVIIAEAKTVSSSSGSSGCNAGFAGLLLLAAAPLACLRGRK